MFQSALRFAVVSDPTPWHAVLTSPVVVVLHTTPPHPLQPGGRTCPQWGKTPRHVPYTPEAVFGRSPTPLLQDAQSRGAGRLRRSLPRAGSRPEARDPAQGAVGFAVRPPVVVSAQPFASAHELAQSALRNLNNRLGLSASGRVVSTRAAPPSQPGSTDFKKLRRDPAQPVS